jgi:C-terminal processing protease CtpA/Prc
MRRIAALLITAGLAVTPTGVAAGPSQDPNPDDAPAEAREETERKPRLGVMVMTLTRELREFFGVPEDRGVLVARVRPGSPAAAAGIAVGDVLTEVRGKAVDDAGDVTAALAGVPRGHEVVVGLVRAGKPLDLRVKLTDPLRQAWAPIVPGFDWIQELMTR